MSIIIKGMKMPKCCDVCQFSAWSNLHQTAMCKIYGYEPCFEDFSREYTSKRSNVCQRFICPDCPKWNKEYGDCDDDLTYCIDRMDEFFKTHELYKAGRKSYYEIWKCREKVSEE